MKKKNTSADYLPNKMNAMEYSWGHLQCNRVMMMTMTKRRKKNEEKD